jgi:A1 cistron-splicing factor AAR2
MEDTAAVLCLGCPPGMEIGVDLRSWTSLPSFQGLKLLPPGVHLLYYRAVSTKDDRKEQGPRVCQMVYLGGGDVLVRKWNPATEEFVPERELDEDEVLRYQLGVKRYDFDSSLGAYPKEMEAAWISLTNFVTQKTLQTQLDCMRTKDGLVLASWPKKHPPVATRHTPHGLSGADLTRHNLDKSALLASLIAARGGDPLSLLAELQYSFLFFLIGEQLEAFEHWKRLLVVVCGCQSALQQPDYIRFFTSFVDVLAAQLALAPADLFIDPLSSGSFLESSLRDFLRTLAELPHPPDMLRNQGLELRKLVQSKFGVDVASESALHAEEGEDAPVIVPAEAAELREL